MAARAAYAFYDLAPREGVLLDDALAGLSAMPKTLPPKYFYDARGSALFDEICDLPEYYPTRTELGMLARDGAEITARVGPRPQVIEYGSGAARKTVLLLRAVGAASYVAIDIAREQLRASMDTLTRLFPDVRMSAVCADYSRPLDFSKIDDADARRRVVFFPGSTIGNFTIPEALDFLKTARRLAGAGGALLVGVDVKKDPAVLNAAYNDSRGVTAAFNLNLLTRLNRELGADFDVAAFRHRAYYNEIESRVEMHLVSTRDQRIHVAGREFRVAEGETIHTENSYKYAPDEFAALASGAGFEPAHCWIDPERLFSIHYLTVP